MRICGCIQDIDVCHILCTCKYVVCDRKGIERERGREIKKRESDRQKKKRKHMHRERLKKKEKNKRVIHKKRVREK